jgi:hypothetical protein
MPAQTMTLDVPPASRGQGANPTLAHGENRLFPRENGQGARCVCLALCPSL